MLIVPVHRVEGSGSTFVFTRYLSSHSEEWRRKVGYAERVNWLTKTGAENTRGMLLTVAHTPGSIGYSSYTAYAMDPTNLTAVMVSDGGEVISPATRDAMVEAVRNIDQDVTALAVKNGARSYPILLPNFAAIKKQNESPEKLADLMHFLEFAMTRAAQNGDEGEGLMGLSQTVLQSAKAQLRTIAVEEGRLQ